MNKIKEIFFPTRDLSKRVGLMDEVRGLLIILMVIYHTLFTLSYTIAPRLYTLIENPVVYILRDIGAGLFILICGASCLYSRNNFRRGMLTFLAGVVITVVTVFWQGGNMQILWGILHFLGLSLILYDLLEKPILKIKWWWGLPVFAVLFVLTYGLNDPYGYGYVGVPFVPALQFPFQMHLSHIHYLFPLGITYPSFSSMDYFPLLPWFFIFLIGTFYGKRLKCGRANGFVYKTHFKPLAFVGRHTLIIYLLHQPVLYGIIYLIQLFM